MWDIHQTRVYFVASVAKVIHDELTQVMPTLLQKLLPKANVKLLSFFISILLKKRCKHMSLVQRVISDDVLS